MILLLKVTLLFAAGWLAAFIMARKSASARHFVWALTLTGAVALAIAAPVAVVPLRLAIWPAAAAPIVPVTADVSTPLPGLGSAEVARVTSIPNSPAGTVRTRWNARIPDGATLFGELWLVGALVIAGWYGLGHLRLFRLARRAVPITNPEWYESLREVAEGSGVSAPVRLFRTDAVGSPLTWGARRPVILLPTDAESWSAERQRVVLAHELAHAVRGDYLSQLIACATCAVYWFHPLAWVAARRLRVESERACDDHVLVRGVSGVDYAAHLLEVARQSRTMRLGGAVAIGMARPSHLEGRLLAVLDPACPRQTPPRRAQRAGWAGLAALVLPLAILTPAAGGSTAISAAKPSLAPETSGAGSVATTPHRPGTPGIVASTQPIRQGRDSSFERSASASPGEQLELDLESGGGVDIRGWDRPMVRVRGHLGGRDWADTRVTLERTDGGVRLHAWQNEQRRSSETRHLFEVMVPRRYDVHISSAGGTVTLAEVEGTFEGETGGGGYRIDHVSGTAHLGTGGGEIRVSDSDLRGRVNTGGGLVMLSKVRGGLKGSSGSGPVIYSDAGAGDLSGVSVDRGSTRVSDERGIDSKGVAATVSVLHIEKAGGDITLDAAPEGAEVSTGGGEVRVGRASGFVSANTGGGNVSVGPVAGSVKAGTGAGTVYVWISKADVRDNEHLIEVFSGHGSVVLELPDDLSARFDLETAYTEQSRRKGRIESDWNLHLEETDRWDDSEGSPRKYVRATGSVGSRGPIIRVKTVDGDITVRRRKP